MDYAMFKDVLNRELPLNRKERFYTATVLPSLLFHKGLSNFYRFLREIRNFPSDINEESTGDTFLFYTEYNLKQSGGKKSVGKEISTPTGDTPDVIIEILRPPRVFVFIEGKMFENLAQPKLDKQMKRQRIAVIDVLKKDFNTDDDHIFHVALIPKGLGFKDTLDYQVINWELFKDDHGFKVQDNYFYNYLTFALDHYKRLVGDKFRQAETVKGYETGLNIYQNWKEQKGLWIGRRGGRLQIIKDIEEDKWQDRAYCWNTEKPQKGLKGHWISSEEFVKLVETNKRQGE
jgi:hypothetical protein